MINKVIISHLSEPDRVVDLTIVASTNDSGFVVMSSDLVDVYSSLDSLIDNVLRPYFCELSLNPITYVNEQEL